MPSTNTLLDHLSDRLPDMIELLRGLVEHESPSGDTVALNALGETLEGRLKGAGASGVERIGNPRGGDHLRARFDFGHEGGGPKPALILGHFDTVWPVGTLKSMPFRLEGDRIHGPGSLDMKGGLTLTIAALEAIRDLGLAMPRPVVVLFTTDEEVGSPDSRPLIEEAAKGAAYALVPEPPLPGGPLKTSRKGVGRYTLAVSGVPAHAGIEPEKGRSALLELSHQIIAIHALSAPESGTTLTVGRASGGGAVNVVPSAAVAEIDLRVTNAAEADRVDRALRALMPRLDGTTLRLDGGMNRPPMERSDASVALFERAVEAARPLGIALREGSTGGGSDGNFTAALGLPTLDGLGPLGAGPHAVHEHVERDSLAPRAALLATLLLAL